jgi:hypothetical protein
MGARPQRQIAFRQVFVIFRAAAFNGAISVNTASRLNNNRPLSETPADRLNINNPPRRTRRRTDVDDSCQNVA